VLPLNDGGLPSYPSDIPEKGRLPFFDTLTMYQLCAEALGYRLNAVRDLQGTNTLERHYSSDVLHVNAASYYRTWKDFTDQRFRRYHRLLLQFDYLLVRSQIARLPGEYGARLAQLGRDLVDLGITTDELGREVLDLFRERGVSARVFDRDEWRFLRSIGQPVAAL
jgi:hypothetical protein